LENLRKHGQAKELSGKFDHWRVYERNNLVDCPDNLINGKEIMVKLRNCPENIIN
jgi:hypothetical protein